MKSYLELVQTVLDQGSWQENRTGIRTLSRVDFTNSNVLIVAVSIGVGIIPITVPEVYTHIPEWMATIFESGISATAIFAVLLNLAFNHFSKTDEPAPAAEH